MSDLRGKASTSIASYRPGRLLEVADMVGLGAKMPFETIPRSEWDG